MKERFCEVTCLKLLKLEPKEAISVVLKVIFLVFCAIEFSFFAMLWVLLLTPVRSTVLVLLSDIVSTKLDPSKDALSKKVLVS